MAFEVVVVVVLRLRARARGRTTDDDLMRGGPNAEIVTIPACRKMRSKNRLIIRTSGFWSRSRSNHVAMLQSSVLCLRIS